MHRICSFLFILLLGFLSGWSQSSLERELRAIATDSGLRNAGLSVTVIDVSSNQLVANLNSKQSLKPASSLKVLTTATALIVLGADYRFETRLEYTGYIDAAGTLHGNVYIRGSGDPTLGSPYMEGTPELSELLASWTETLQRAGIRSIEGCIIGDASAWEGRATPSDWSEKDGGNYYAAGAWALNIHENLYYLPFRQVAVLGATPGIGTLRPPVPGLQFDNQIRSAGRGSGDNAYIYGAPYQFKRPIKGSIPVGNGVFTIKGSVPDAPLWAAQLFQEAAEEAGIEVAHVPSTSDEESPDKIRETLLVHRSPPMGAIIERANKESVNLYCEVLLRAIGKKRTGVGSPEAGIRVVREVWEARGVDFSGGIMYDGSGLSQKNALSSYQLAQVVRKMQVDAAYQKAFFESLAVAGRDGTLAYLLRGTPGEGRVWAKSGSMKGVRSYTGFARGDSGKLYAFSMIANDFACSSRAMIRKFEQVLLALVEQ